MSDPSIVGDLPPLSITPPRDYVADGIEAIEKAQTDRLVEASTFEHDGESYRLGSTIDLRVVVALQRGNFLRALELALVGGIDDVDRLIASGEPIDPARLETILDTWASALGTSLGE